jgi:HAMP domain-containing protein
MQLIKTKIVIGVLVAMAASLVVVFAGLRSLFEGNRDRALAQALAAAQAGIATIEASEVRALDATLLALSGDEALRAAFVARDRAALVAHAGPTFAALKKTYNITHFYFIEPDGTCFLRVHQPDKYGDVIERATFTRARKKGAMAAGKELGKTGYALRVVEPYRSRDGVILGYVELGEEIERYASLLAGQTGDDVSLVADKMSLDRNAYAEVQAAQGRRDRWDDHPGVVVLASTHDALELARFDLDLAAIPDAGLLLGAASDGDRTLVRGVVPLVDASGRKSGGIFIRRDVTAVVAGLASARMRAAALFVAVAAIISFIAVFTLQRLVFARLRRLADSMMRVVGGDFERPIPAGPRDEVGEIEGFLEQLRRVLVDTMHEVERRSGASRRP